MTRQSDPLVDAFRQFGMSMEEFAKVFAQEIAPHIQRVAAEARALYDLTYAEYVNQGAIYGESHDGLMRWLTEIGQIKALVDEAREIQERQEWAAVLRQLKTAD